MKKIWPFVLGALLLFGSGFLIAHFRGNAALAEQKAQNEQDKAAMLAGQIKTLADQIAKNEQALAQLKADSAAREKWFQGQLSRINTATPQQLVDQGSSILNAHDILTDGKTVTMGVETYRAVVWHLADWQEYKDTREPAWAKERGMLNGTISDLKAQMALDAQKDAALAASIADLKHFITEQKTATFFEKVIYAAGGVGVGMLAGRLLK